MAVECCQQVKALGNKEGNVTEISSRVQPLCHSRIPDKPLTFPTIGTLLNVLLQDNLGRVNMTRPGTSSGLGSVCYKDLMVIIGLQLAVG